MAYKADTGGERRWRRWAIAGWATVAALILLSLATMFVMAATDDDENIAFSRNEVVRTASGERSWHGTFWNHSDSLYTKLDAVILFLDKDGKPVGQATGGAVRLDPGEYFNLEAPLPPEAVHMRMYQLRWTGPGGRSRVLGPWRAWEFGYAPHAEKCGELRLTVESCTPMRKVGAMAPSAEMQKGIIECRCEILWYPLPALAGIDGRTQPFSLA